MTHEPKKTALNPIEQMIPDLRQISAARLGIGRAGGSLTTEQVLDFDLAHARARDAVNREFEPFLFQKMLEMELGTRINQVSIVSLNSMARDRATYLKRPDLGRRLNQDSIASLQNVENHGGLTIIISDGLSSQATIAQAPPVMKHLLDELSRDLNNKTIAIQIMIIPYARVGISDHVGELLKLDSSIILLGERPGLATPESLGAYYTFQPRSGKTDADRNCISNIHSQGLSPEIAAEQLTALFNAGSRTGMSGVKLSEYMAMDHNIEIKSDPN